MKKNNLKSKLKKGGVLMGWTSIPSTVIAEIITEAGFDAVVVDLEHSATTLHELEPLVQVIEGFGASPMARLSNNDPVLIKQVLDIGLHGIIVPMVNSAEEAHKAVGAAKYPPLGFRSTAIYRAQNFGLNFHDYRFKANDQVAVILQIEHKDAVENIEEIVKVPGIDALMIGPYDLSSSYGIAGQLDHPIMKKAISKVLTTAKKAGVNLGTHLVEPDIKLLQKALKEFAFVIYSNDSIILAKHYRELIGKLRPR